MFIYINMYTVYYICIALFFVYILFPLHCWSDANRDFVASVAVLCAMTIKLNLIYICIFIYTYIFIHVYLFICILIYFLFIKYIYVFLENTYVCVCMYIYIHIKMVDCGPVVSRFVFQSGGWWFNPLPNLAWSVYLNTHTHTHTHNLLKAGVMSPHRHMVAVQRQ